MPSSSADSGAVRLTILGAADAFCSAGHLNATYFFEAARSTFLIDCGPTVLYAMKRRGLDTARIDFVVISHLHGDHFGGLAFLLLEYMYERPRTRPLVVLGPRGIEERVWTLFRALYADVGVLNFPLRFEELVPECPASIADLRVLPVRVPHQVEDVALALQLEIDGKRILYSGDSPWVDRFVELAAGADLFLCECTAYDKSMGRHICYRELQPLLPKLGCRRLVLIHLGREMREHAAEIAAECAVEDMVITL